MHSFLFKGLRQAVPWVGLQYVVVVFPDLTHLLFDQVQTSKYSSSENTTYRLKLEIDSFI